MSLDDKNPQKMLFSCCANGFASVKESTGYDFMLLMYFMFSTMQTPLPVYQGTWKSNNVTFSLQCLLHYVRHSSDEPTLLFLVLSSVQFYGFYFDCRCLIYSYNFIVFAHSKHRYNKMQFGI